MFDMDSKEGYGKFTYDIRKRAYDRYLHDWMVSRGISIADINSATQAWMNECSENEDYDISFSEFLFEHGFGGSSWVSFEEFLGAEYLMEDYMRNILTDDEFSQYLLDRGISARKTMTDLQLDIWHEWIVKEIDVLQERMDDPRANYNVLNERINGLTDALTKMDIIEKGQRCQKILKEIEQDLLKKFRYDINGNSLERY